MDAITASSQQPKSGENFAQQYVVTFIATLMLVSSGWTVGWSSPALPLLKDASSPVAVNGDEAAWIVAFLDMGTLIAAIPTVWLMDRFGRRLTLLLAAVPLAISWALLATARHLAAIFIGRLLGGFSMGVAMGIVPIYLGEIASVRLRGRLSAMIVVTYQLGILLAYAIGYAVASQAWLSWLALVPLALFVSTAIWAMPESPYWLMVHDRQADAKSGLRRLCGRHDVQAEWEILCDQERCSGRGGFGLAEVVREPANRRAMVIIVGVTAIQMMCGSVTTVSYAESIFARLMRDDQSATAPIEEPRAATNVAGLVSIVFGSVQLLAATGSVLVVDFVGRRPLLLISLLGTIVCNGLVAVYLHLSEAASEAAQQRQLEQLSWLPVVAIMLGVVFFFVGLAPVVFAQLAELLPAHLRRLGGAVYTVTSAALIFAVNKLYQVVGDAFGVSVAFWSFAVCGLVFLPFIWCCVPETRGRELSDIRADLAAGWRGWRLRRPKSEKMALKQPEKIHTLN